MSRPEIAFVEASPAHVGSIANRMRFCDVRECWAFGHSPKQALRLGIMGSVEAWTVTINGRPEAMLGVSPVSVIESVGRPWMLATGEAFRHGRAMLKMGPDVVSAMGTRFARLENVVAADNARAIRLLRRLGFTIGGDAINAGGVPFLPFQWRRSDV